MTISLINMFGIGAGKKNHGTIYYGIISRANMLNGQFARVGRRSRWVSYTEPEPKKKPHSDIWIWSYGGGCDWRKCLKKSRSLETGGRKWDRRHKLLDAEWPANAFRVGSGPHPLGEMAVDCLRRVVQIPPNMPALLLAHHFLGDASHHPPIPSHPTASVIDVSKPYTPSSRQFTK